MNKRPIDSARDADLRLSQQALRRAARRARELAAQTGTAIVVSCNGVLQEIRPGVEDAVPSARDAPAPYGTKK